MPVEGTVCVSLLLAALNDACHRVQHDQLRRISLDKLLDLEATLSSVERLERLQLVVVKVAEVLFEVFEDFDYTDGVVNGDVGFLVARARVGGQPIEMVDHLRLGPDKRVEEMTVFFRPLPAAAAALRAIGAGLGRRKSRALGAVISGLTLPLAVMTRIGDKVGVGLIRASL